MIRCRCATLPIVNNDDNSILLADTLRSMRGVIVNARIAYPEVLHVEIKDSAEGLWRLATQDAEWSPVDPDELVGRSIVDADIDAGTGELRCTLSDGSLLDVRPAVCEAEDDPPSAQSGRSGHLR